MVYLEVQPESGLVLTRSIDRDLDFASETHRDSVSWHELLLELVGRLDWCFDVGNDLTVGRPQTQSFG